MSAVTRHSRPDSAMILVVNSGPEGVDSGPEGVDSGPERVDSGPEGVDSGPEGVDSGPEGVDSGPERVDSGPEVVNERRHPAQPPRLRNKPGSEFRLGGGVWTPQRLF
jgi:hypothetical protein